MLPASPIQNATYDLPSVSSKSLITPPRPFPSQPIPKQSSQEVDEYEEIDTWEYDYPYLDERLLRDVSPSKDHQNNTSLRKTTVKKSLSYNGGLKHSSQAATTMQNSGDKYEELTSLKPPSPFITRSISHGGIPNENDDLYVRMNSEKQLHYTNSVAKSHVLDNTSTSTAQHGYINVPKPAERSHNGVSESLPTSNHRKLIYCSTLKQNEVNLYLYFSATDLNIPMEFNRHSAYVNHDCNDLVYYNNSDDDGNYLELVSSYTANGNAHKSKKPVYNRRKKPQVAPKPAL